MKRSSVFYWSVGVLIAAAAVAVAFHFDEPVRNFLSQHENRVARNFMHHVSRFGDWPAHFIIGALLAAVAYWRGNKKWTRVFVAMLIALAVGGIAARGLKIATARARPAVKIEEIATRSHFSANYHSFPSGHVAASTAFFAVLVFANWRIGLATLAIPLLIAWARMYAGAHYLSDVVCAAVLGALCAFAVTCTPIFFSIENRQPKIDN